MCMPAVAIIVAVAVVATVIQCIGIEQQLYEIVRGKIWKFTEMIMITNEVISENLVVMR